MHDPTTARWNVSCWTRANRSHLFDLRPGHGPVLISACGHQEIMLNDAQPEDRATMRCALCLKSKPKG